MSLSQSFTKFESPSLRNKNSRNTYSSVFTKIKKATNSFDFIFSFIFFSIFLLEISRHFIILIRRTPLLKFKNRCKKKKKSINNSQPSKSNASKNIWKTSWKPLLRKKQSRTSSKASQRSTMQSSCKTLLKIYFKPKPITKISEKKQRLFDANTPYKQTK